MKKKEFERTFWKQYLMMEKNFIEALNYVEFDVVNFSTYSTVFTKLLLEIGSEVDNVFRVICQLPGKTYIHDYAPIILEQYPNITTQIVKSRDSSIVFTPFAGWATSESAKSLVFWTQYNNVKHDRLLNSTVGSLGAVANTLAGLFLLEMYYLDDLYKADKDEWENLPEQVSQFFYLDMWFERIRVSKAVHRYGVIDDDDGRVILPIGNQSESINNTL